jgi:prepilin-type processing-associated H-X9-DG protein
MPPLAMILPSEMVPPSSPPLYMPDRKKKALRIAIVVIITCVTLPVLALLVAIFMPSIGEAREQARRALCEANLKGIRASIIIYSAENGDAYPPNLEVMIDTGVMMKGMLICPSAENSRGCDYFYSPPAKTTLEDTNAKTIIACDFKDNHKGDGRNVLFADGHTQWMTEDEFQVALQQPYNAAFVAALRKDEGP